MEAEVSSALRGGSSHDVLSEGFGLRLTRKDLQTLSNLNWLNDEVSPRWVQWVFLWLCMQPQHHQCVFSGSIYGVYVAKSRHAAHVLVPIIQPSGIVCDSFFLPITRLHSHIFTFTVSSTFKNVSKTKSWD